jgi:putative toxin-antitoxin system antitoxin component (TIGR02293 family)
MKIKSGHKAIKISFAIPPAAAERGGSYGRRWGGAADYIAAIRRGIGYKLIHSVQTEYDFSDKLFAHFIGISDKTLFRLKKSDGKLSALSADRVYRLWKIRVLANKVLESSESALAWLRRPQPGLGGAVPLDILDTEPGYEQVQRLLNQIEFGVLS